MRRGPSTSGGLLRVTISPMDTCPLCGLEPDHLEDHTTDVHGRTLEQIDAEISAGLRDLADEMTKHSRSHGVRAVNLVDPYRHPNGLEEGGYL